MEDNNLHEKLYLFNEVSKMGKKNKISILYLKIDINFIFILDPLRYWCPQ